MSLRVIRISPAAYTMLQKLSDAVMGLPIPRVVEELARVDPSVFRKKIVERMNALPASDSDDGSSGEAAGTTTPARTKSAADAGAAPGAAPGNVPGNTHSPRTGSATSHGGASNPAPIGTAAAPRTASAAGAGAGTPGGIAGSTSPRRAGSVAPPSPKSGGEK